MVRKQFTFYSSFYTAIENLKTDRERLQAYRAICQYALCGTLPNTEEMKPSATAVFSLVAPILDRARQRAKSAQKGSTLSKQEKE